MADSSWTRPNPVQRPSTTIFQPINTKPGSPHESDSSTRPRPKPGRGRVRSGNPVQNPSNLFTASTCSKCAAIVLAGQILGLRLNLEPTMLNDHTEYQALADGIPTYDLWPDRIARRRHLEQIKWPDRVPRHAQHTCGTQYGTDPRPNPPTTPRPDPHGPPPF